MMFRNSLTNIASSDSEITREFPGLGKLPRPAGRQPALPFD